MYRAPMTQVWVRILAVVGFVVLGSAVMLGAALSVGAVIASLFRMRCPRCDGRVAWLCTGYVPGRISRSIVWCFRCRRYVRIASYGDHKWVEYTTGP